MVCQIVSRVLDLGSADAWISDWSYRGTMVGAAAMVTARAVLVHEHRHAWGLIAAGLAAWTAGDLAYVLDLPGDRVAYSSATDVLYFLSFGSFIVGLRLLRGRARASLALTVVLLAMTTLWSWLVFSDVVESAVGGSAVAHPLLDLVLVGSVVLALGARGWRAGRAFWLLAGGLLAMALGDSAYATQVAHGMHADDTAIELLWPIGALCVAGAAWTPPAAKDVNGTELRWVIELLSAVGIAGAVIALVVDHFTPVDTVTFALSCATLSAALAQRIVIYRQRAKAQKAATAAEALRGAAMDAIVRFDNAGIVSEWNDAAVTMFGYSREEAFGAELGELVRPPAARERHRQGVAQMGTVEGERLLNRQLEAMMLNAEGTEFPVELMIVQSDVDPPRFTAFLRDISERLQREEENGRLAALVRSSNNAIISTSLDGIVSAWNSSAERLYGYTMQEALGQHLSSLIIPSDRADEMKAIVDSVLDREIRTFETQRQCKDGSLRDVSLRAFAIRDMAGELTGVCTSTHDVTERRRADERERRDQEGRLWRDRVRTALDEGHFMFWGQPVVDAASGAIDHHELLLRMDLDGNVITPNQFLPHAENSPLITEIDRFAITTGLEFAATMPVAINISAQGIEDPDLIDHIRRAIKDESVARNVIFEITETAAVAKLDAAAELVRELTARGFRVALDDFGTGYGSFTYLQHLPVTELKIDIEFVRALADDPTDHRLVKSLVSVAQNFGMKTVAEGVEDEATASLLRELGVDLLQGYYLGYPAQMTLSSRWSAAPVTIRSGPLAEPWQPPTPGQTPRISRRRS
jgi:PAS domain S-box-containing protein